MSSTFSIPNAPIMPGLYLVASPIGNLGDISLRALSILHQSDLILCEDTRVSLKLLNHYGIHKPLESFHAHNAQNKTPYFIEKLKQGMTLAVLSDAGMPLISDPGLPLVQAAHHENIYMTVIPGASAPLMALVLSGLTPLPFYFGGFLPTRATERCKTLETLCERTETLIFFETPHRIVDALQDLLTTLGNRKIAIGRELTKKFEEILRGSLQDFVSGALPITLKGEMVIVIEGVPEIPFSIPWDEIDNEIRNRLSTTSARDISALLFKAYPISKKELYQRVLKIKDLEF